jgi:N6-L-threonylcarbamoyladenine synthase
MRILAIETSCDETAIAIVDCSANEENYLFAVKAQALDSQIDKHREYGGVFPSVAKREHAKNIYPLMCEALEKSALLKKRPTVIPLDYEVVLKVQSLLSHYEGLAQLFVDNIQENEIPDIDAIAVTHGPGLPPALWVGVSVAKALSLLWSKPLVGVNHMEGHIFAGLAKRSDTDTYTIEKNTYPMMSLLISGGHTELVYSENVLSYKKIGQTLDDAVGEAFDKVARMLSLPYPGGPEISALAEKVRSTLSSDDSISNTPVLPRPLLHDGTCNFSFSGLKTACMYALKKIPNISTQEQERFAYAFEEAVTEVLYKKTVKALELYPSRALVIGGGVAANTHIRRTFENKLAQESFETALSIPERVLTGDNGMMIAFAAYIRICSSKHPYSLSIEANGNLSVASV